MRGFQRSANSRDNPISRDSRLIAGSTSPQVFRHSLSHSLLMLLLGSTNSPSVLNDLSLREDGFMPYARTTRTQPETATATPSTVGVALTPGSAANSPTSHLHTYIADALGFQEQHRVLNFQSGSPTKNTSGSKPRAGEHTHRRSGDEYVNPMPVSPSSRLLRSPRLKTVPKMHPTTVLQAPGLRNDFYSNLVTWSKCTGNILVGLKDRVFVWCANNDVKQITMGRVQGIVTAVSCSSQEYFALATLNGFVAVGDVKSRKILTHIDLTGNCAYCLVWSSAGDFVFAGDARGDVLVLQVCRHGDTVRLSERCRIKTNTEQICGISISPDSTELAVGGNDNRCTVWNIENIDRPQLRHVLAHTAAVKALAYCPWSPSLLASGGGSKDRHVRFWHTRSGTLLLAVKTDWQITSVLWSRMRRELAVTFGFSAGRQEVMLRVYSYPGMQCLREVAAATTTARTLGACLSPDGLSVCMAINDESIQIYQAWISQPLFAAAASQAFGKGAYQSSIIELVEGVDDTGDLIR